MTQSEIAEQLAQTFECDVESGEVSFTYARPSGKAHNTSTGFTFTLTFIDGNQLVIQHVPPDAAVTTLKRIVRDQMTLMRAGQHAPHGVGRIVYDWDMPVPMLNINQVGVTRVNGMGEPHDDGPYLTLHLIEKATGGRLLVRVSEGEASNLRDVLAALLKL